MFFTYIYSMTRYKPSCHDETNDSGDYIEVWCVPSATHVLCLRRNYNGILSIRV